MSHSSEDTAGKQLISVRDGYIAMFRFLVAYWERGKRIDNGIGLLCGDVAPVSDPDDDEILRSSDPALWGDWLASVSRALRDGPLDSLESSWD